MTLRLRPLLLTLTLLGTPAIADSSTAAAELQRAQQSHDQALRDYGKAKEDAAWADKLPKKMQPEPTSR